MGRIQMSNTRWHVILLGVKNIHWCLGRKLRRAFEHCLPSLIGQELFALFADFFLEALMTKFCDGFTAPPETLPSRSRCGKNPSKISVCETILVWETVWDVGVSPRRLQEGWPQEKWGAVNVYKQKGEHDARQGQMEHLCEVGAYVRRSYVCHD